MAIITGMEIVDLLIMIAAIGFIFKDLFKKPIESGYDPLKHFAKNMQWENFKYAALATAPAIVLHEAAHKIVALSFGIPAVFHAAYEWLVLGIVIKLLNFPFLFFIPGYVSYSAAAAEPMQIAVIAFAGPAMNLAIFIFATIALKKDWFPKHRQIINLTKKINLFLFIFNMIPIPPFDGSHVFGNIIQAF